MKKIAIGFLVIVLICLAGFFAFRYGYDKGFEETSTQTPPLFSPEITPPVEITTLVELQDSKVVYDLIARGVSIVLKGEIIEVSVSDRIIIVQANGDSLTVYLKEDAIMPIPGQEPQKIEMESIKTGEEVTIIAILTAKGLEGTTFFIGDVKTKLR